MVIPRGIKVTFLKFKVITEIEREMKLNNAKEISSNRAT